MSDYKKPVMMCLGCGHPIHKHYTDPLGHIRCMCVAKWVTTTGVIGLHSQEECDCDNYISKQADYRKIKETEAKLKDDMITDSLVKEIEAAVSKQLGENK